jgi:hypothetical protein
MWTPDCEVLEAPELREFEADTLARGAGCHTRLRVAPRGPDAQWCQARAGTRGWSDAASLIKTASLAYREGTSDKVYEVDRR